jgi:hypothetical protein
MPHQIAPDRRDPVGGGDFAAGQLQAPNNTQERISPSILAEQEGAAPNGDSHPEIVGGANGEYAEVANRTNAYTNGLLTQKEAAAVLGCTPAHLSARCKDAPSILIDGRRLYDRGAILAWKAARPVKTISRGGSTYERRPRSFSGDIERLERAAYDIAAEQQPMTVRQLYYQLTVRGLVPKDRHGYNQTVVLLKNMRDAAYDSQIKVSVEMPIDWVIDNSRRNEERQNFINPEAALDWIARIYRKDFWHEEPERVLVVVEKDALAGTLYEITEPYDVPVIVPRGYSSISYVARLVEEIEGWEEQDIYLYYFADLDPSGQDAARAFEDRLRMMLGAEEEGRVLVESAAITPTQVRQYNLWPAGRDTKTSDSRAAGFFAEHGNGAQSYELDALPPNDLRQLVRDCIRNHVSDDVHAVLLSCEQEERERLATLIGRDDDIDYAWGWAP